jgi:imidazole glycerol-phosphate synthase subunit HisH
VNRNRKKIGIIDTSVSNIQSVIYALKKFDVDIIILDSFTSKNFGIDGIVVPGIGSFPEVQKKIENYQLDKFIINNIFKIPSLFICIGMQLLFEKSEEFESVKGLGVLKGDVKKIPNNYSQIIRSVPHNGWNTVCYNNKSKIYYDIKDRSNFYFTHSYYIDPSDKNIVSGITNYKQFSFCSSIEYKNIYACQFHPEKSSKDGLKIYQNWINLI